MRPDGAALNIVLTLLYAPADRVERAHKAMSSPADVVILDLEDAVAPTAKEAARLAVPSIVSAHPGRPVYVRVNAVGTPWAAADLAMVAELPSHVGLKLAKVDSPADVAAATSVTGARPVHCLLETAVGVEAAAEIARTPGVASITLGEGDLRSDLGLSDEGALDWCRHRIVVAARAGGLPPPAMAVHSDLADVDGLASSSRRARRQGFVGRAAIHPKQLPVIEAAFRPDDDELKRARSVVEAVEAAQAVGSGTSVLADGRFVDVAMVEYARGVLALGERTSAVV